jgi:phosphotriesterase-related protein
MDRFGIDTISNFTDRVNTVATLCRRGHAGKMERDVPHILPNWHYLHIHNDVIPALRACGVTGEQVHTMLVENPRNIFAAS